MKQGAAPIRALVRELSRLPGIGEKTALRLAYFVLAGPAEHARALAQAIVDVKEKITLCGTCGNLTDVDPCAICADPGRDPGLVCVVEQPRDVLAVEKTKRFAGVYHVLHGALSPLDGIGPDALRIAPLVARVADGGVREVILATNPTVEGDATAVHLADVLKRPGLTVSRIAHGVPAGADLETTDEVTLGYALGGRTAM
jgi:recombination protein RecR